MSAKFSKEAIKQQSELVSELKILQALFAVCAEHKELIGTAELGALSEVMIDSSERFWRLCKAQEALLESMESESDGVAKGGAL